MSAPADEPMVLFDEEGSSWWPVLVGPALALAGGLAEETAPGGAAWPLWIVVGVVIGAVTALVVRARRRFLRVVLTARTLQQGSTLLPVADIAAVRADDGSGAYGVRVLGDGPVVPRRYDALVLRLRDGAYRVAWARDGDGLRRALALVVGGPDDPDGSDVPEGSDVPGGSDLPEGAGDLEGADEPPTPEAAEDPDTRP